MNMLDLNEDQLKKLNTWKKKHDKRCRYKNKQGAIGGRITYEFTPTAIGMVSRVKCACGGEVDLSDYESW